MNAELVQLLDAIAALNVVVIGDAMLDCYLEGFSDRLCPEAPVPVVTITNRKDTAGGAANTAVNLQSLGAKVRFLSAVGDDWEAGLMRQVLQQHSVSDRDVLMELGRQTLAKQRVIASSQMVVRFDRGSTNPINRETEQALIDVLECCFLECDAVVVSDYGYGIMTAKVIDAIAQFQQRQPHTLIVDSKNLAAYRDVGVTAVKPNYHQAIKLLGILSVEPTARAAQIAVYQKQLLELTGARIVAVTLDAEGALILESDRSHRTYARRVSDYYATGAGDTFVAALIALATGIPSSTAADFAAAAAAVVVGKAGTTVCSAQELRQFLSPPLLEEELSSDKYFLAPNELVAHLAARRDYGWQIVFTNGCFDILHAGHVSYLNRAKALGDILIIGVNSDASVSRLKGASRPINPLADRIQVLSGLGCVDYLVAFDEDTPSNLLQMICPDVYVKGGDYTKQTLPEAPLVEQLGGVVEILPFLENRSTTSMIERISAKQGNKHD